jgi:hypothetical protein
MGISFANFLKNANGEEKGFTTEVAERRRGRGEEQSEDWLLESGRY